MDNMTKILLFAGIILLVMYLYISNDNENEQPVIQKMQNNPSIKCPNKINEGFVETNQTESHNDDENNNSQLLSQIHAQENESVESIKEEHLVDKFKTPNQAPDGEYKQINYANGNRNGKIDVNWDNSFKISNDLLGISDQFSPSDETNNQYASFALDTQESVNLKGDIRGKNSKDESPNDIYDVEKLLPKEIKKDWFETTPEPIKVKDRHLITSTRPVGINTIGTTKKYASHDLRGVPYCPKDVISPWLQSSAEPDTNIKPFCGM